ncbi:50S ribosomal protein L13 [Candidatus Shapirobacteria bacterium CG03_land_8_20_14_0_80_40_19]|uniref:Large ribosomal subunit protein uL13 n=4 Tax=Candidatus Shapironibacteriota TaxID=1752721 RepID=A0A2M7BE05_9BACT|nr:MAG: 50S ribosomal protein L13 [Candidatus Shapirobacteria bacterium CG11_big_fil_rev_8_21_14_0_20_40_12]PIV01342.1 MAG: 50S ribosomal protein L13 [Candidatus Shapirobacteria bacterium CG03_land_8_20_14_0_80_40_19]PJC29218.1 MAG: 50S ribosomal protein L13 [Candidatus Shapirobacteria bacterium CG_4_9_14_0_2_um_filter_40_11]PJC76677.1 MAG: 50S ribosomal protein L13 [Candidatus Shapirobacteria bacterium CG_4_8_14_3_um_filter_39_11]
MIKPTKKTQIKSAWHIFDAKDQILGRLASKIAPVLFGKSKPYFVRNLDCGDHVVVVNASLVKVTGKKETEKKYTSFSGYPGGLKTLSLSQLREKKPERIIEKAVLNMLPKNKLRDQWMKRLHVFAGEKHPYEEKFKEKK